MGRLHSIDALLAAMKKRLDKVEAQIKQVGVGTTTGRDMTAEVALGSLAAVTVGGATQQCCHKVRNCWVRLCCVSC